jgi:hypothetical protein
MVRRTKEDAHATLNLILDAAEWPLSVHGAAANRPIAGRLPML